MEVVHNTLDSLRRTHLVLSVASVAILLLAIPTGPDFEAGLVQLRTLSAVLGEGGYAQRCAQTAGGRYVRAWEAARAYEGPQPVLLPPEAILGGFAICGMPLEGSSLDDAVEFLGSAESVMFASFDPADLHAALRDPDLVDGPLMSATVTLVDDPEFKETSVFIRDDTLDIEVIDPSWAIGDDPAPLMLRATNGTSQSWGTARTPLVGGIGRITRPTTVLDWLSETEWGSRALADSARGELTVLQHLQPFWSEIGASSLTEAARYLQTRADDQQGSVEVLGMNLDATMIVWGGPLFILVLLSHMLLHLQHLDRLAEHNRGALATYPWVALFPGAQSTVLRFTSILFLPVAACTAVALRAWPALVTASAWSMLALVACLVMGLSILSLLGRLRRAT